MGAGDTEKPEPPADPRAQAEILAELNATRIADLEAKAGQPGSLENAFDLLRILTLLENIAYTMGVTDKANLDFEGRKGDMLDNIENKYHAMKKAQEAAQRQQRLAGGPVGIRGGIPQRPGPGGIVRPRG
jgi:hypothetical protein